MLTTLQSLSPEAAQDALGEVIKHLTPQPFEIPPPSETAMQVLREVRAELKLSPEDTSDRAEAQVLERVGDEFADIALKDADLDEIHARLVARGWLSDDDAPSKLSPHNAARSKFSASSPSRISSSDKPGSQP